MKQKQKEFKVEIDKPEIIVAHFTTLLLIIHRKNRKESKNIEDPTDY